MLSLFDCLVTKPLVEYESALARAPLILLTVKISVKSGFFHGPKANIGVNELIKGEVPPRSPWCATCKTSLLRYSPYVAAS